MSISNLTLSGSPAFGDKLYPYFDDNRDLIAFSREFTKKADDLTTRTYFETYTKDAHYIWTAEGPTGTEAKNWELVEGYPKQLTIGKIPIVYGSQPAVEWEDVQSLIDRLEKLLSNPLIAPIPFTLSKEISGVWVMV